MKDVFINNPFLRYYKYTINILILLNIYFAYSQSTIAKLPVTFTLYNDNILLVNQDEIVFYDPSLTHKLKNYVLEESEKAENISMTVKTVACQYSKIYDYYIILFVKDHLFLFDKDGNNLTKIDMTSTFSNSNIYEIEPIRKKNNDLFYVISMTSSTPYKLIIYYYKINIVTFINDLVQKKEYNITSRGGFQINGISENVSCRLMHSNTKKNILVCFYGYTYKPSLSVTSFDIENNLNVLESYSDEIETNNILINIIRSKSIGDKSNALIFFYTYGLYGFVSVYDINTNSLREKIQYTDFKIGSNPRCINFEYFYRTEQFLLTFKDTYINFEIIALNKSFDIVLHTSFIYEGKVNTPPWESIVYFKDKEQYMFISDYLSHNGTYINFFFFNFTSEILNNSTEIGDEIGFIENENDTEIIITSKIDIKEEEKELDNEKTQETYEKEKEKIKQIENEEENNSYEIKENTPFKTDEREENKISSKTDKMTIGEEKDFVSQLNSEIDEKEVDSLSQKLEDTVSEKEKEKEKEIEKEKEKEYNSDNYIFLTNNKCSIATKESLEIYNLCIKCNEDLGYYPIIFNRFNIFPKNFKECINEETKLSNFYFNKEKKQYEPCFETCNTCNFGGNEEINNCTSCDVDGEFRPEANGTTNCVKKCRYRYYITPYNQYKCSEVEQCPEEANLYIRNKNKCIENCVLDDKYKYQLEGECIERCPNGTVNENNICIIKDDKNKCSYNENSYLLNDDLTNKNIELLALTYAKEYIYTNNHISIYKNNLFSISIYKDKNCIDELGLTIPKIEFDECQQLIQSEISSNLIVLLIEKYFNGSSLVLYSFYDSLTGKKLNISDKCKESKVVIQSNIISILESSNNINIENILKLTQQNINLFNKDDDFYTDICYHYESPNGKDVTLRDRIKEFFPNITLCNEGCTSKGVNLTSMSAICQCSFNDFVNEKFFTRNAFLSRAMEEFAEMYYHSNLLLLKCYKDVFNFKYLIKNTGGFIILFIIISETILVILFYWNSFININTYIFMLINLYFSYLDHKYYQSNKRSIDHLIDCREPPPLKKKIKKGNNIIYQNNMNIIKLNINNINTKDRNSNDSKNSLNSFHVYKKFKKLRTIDNSIKQKNKDKDKRKLTLFNSSSKKFNLKSSDIKKKTEMKKINNYIVHYLSTDADEMDFDDAYKLDKRKYFQFLWERIKHSILLIGIFLVKEPLKPNTIKIILFLMNVNLYFFINGLFINENYISEVYNEENSSLLSFTKRANYNFFYTTMTGFIIGIIINCIFVEEKKLKALFKREKGNKIIIKNESIIIIQKIKSRYSLFFIIAYIISFFSWYYINCFNNVYPHIKGEWIISSICFILTMQILFPLVLSIVETNIRYLSFKCKSEKLFKISQIFS